MIEQLPALLIILPILLAVFCVIINNERFVVSLLIILHLIIGYWLFIELLALGDESIAKYYAFGGWNAPFGIEFKLSKLNLIFISLMYFISFITILFSINEMDRLIFNGNKSTFFAVYLLCIAGFSGIILTNDIFNLYVFIEIASLASYTLVSISSRKLSIKFGLDYLILGTIAATFLLFGISFLYIATGTLNLTDLALKLGEQYTHSQKIIHVGLSCIIIGLFLKFSLFPFHKWLINIYTNSNYFITIFFSAISAKIMIFILIKLQLALFNGNLFEVMNISKLIASLSYCAVIIGSIIAIFQANLRTVLGYSSITQIGYILIAIILVKQDLELALILIFSHAFAKMLNFMVVAHIGGVSEDITLKFIKNSNINLLTLLVFIISITSLIGLPGTFGFIAKISLILKLFEIKNLYSVIVILLGSVISLIYFWKYFEASYEAYLNKKVIKTKNKQILQQFIMAFIAILLVVLGIQPAIFQTIIEGV
jgi:proton-translocating NADH-quinone oxidoreductase chain N